MEIVDIYIESLLYQSTLSEVMAEKICLYIRFLLEILESESIFTERLIITKTRRLIIIIRKSAELVTLCGIRIPVYVPVFPNHPTTRVPLINLLKICIFVLQQL